MGIVVEFNPDLALRNISEFMAGKRKKQECIPEPMKIGEVYDFLKEGQRTYVLLYRKGSEASDCSYHNIEKALGHEIEWHTLGELLPASGKPLLPPMATLLILGGRKDKIRAFMESLAPVGS